MRARSASICRWTKASSSGSRPGRGRGGASRGAQAQHRLHQRRAVGRVERRLDQPRRASRDRRRGAATIWRDIISCAARNGLSAAAGRRCSRTRSAMARHRRQQRVAGPRTARTAAATGAAARSSSALLRRGRGPHPGLQEGAVEPEIDLRQPRHRGELALVLEVVAAQGPDVVERAVPRSGRCSRRPPDPVPARPRACRPASAPPRRGPGGRQSMKSMLVANSWCSFFATPPETKMPRWPTLSWTQ